MLSSDGSLVSLEEVWDLFLVNTKLEENKDDLLNVITQSEHPLLFRPFFLLHPCKVNEVLSTFPNRYLCTLYRDLFLITPNFSKNFVVTFLSIYSRSLGLKLNPAYQSFFPD